MLALRPPPSQTTAVATKLPSPSRLSRGIPSASGTHCMGSGGRREGHPGTKHHPPCAEVQRKTFSARLRTLRPRAPPGLWLSRWRALRTRTACAAHPRGRCCHSFVCGSPAASYFGRGTEGRVSLIPRPPASTCPGERTRAALPGAHLVPVRISAPRRCLFAPRNFHPPFLCGFSKPCSVWGFSHPLFSPVSGPLRRVAWQGTMAHGDRDGEWRCARSGGGGKCYGGCRERQHAKAKGVSRSYSEPLPRDGNRTTQKTRALAH